MRGGELQSFYSTLLILSREKIKRNKKAVHFRLQAVFLFLVIFLQRMGGCGQERWGFSQSISELMLPFYGRQDGINEEKFKSTMREKFKSIGNSSPEDFGCHKEEKGAPLEG